MDEKRRARTHTTRIPLSNKKFGKAYARMLSRQGPPRSAEIAADGRIFYKPLSDHKNGRNRAARRAVVAPTPGCTPSSPHTQPAPLSTLPGLSCEWESVNVV